VVTKGVRNWENIKSLRMEQQIFAEWTLAIMVTKGNFSFVRNIGLHMSFYSAAAKTSFISVKLR
jgi:hypothetical protein